MGVVPIKFFGYFVRLGVTGDYEYQNVLVFETVGYPRMALGDRGGLVWFETDGKRCALGFQVAQFKATGINPQDPTLPDVFPSGYYTIVIPWVGIYDVLPDPLRLDLESQDVDTVFRDPRFKQIGEAQTQVCTNIIAKTPETTTHVMSDAYAKWLRCHPDVESQLM